MAKGEGEMKIEFEDNFGKVLNEWEGKKKKILTSIGLKATEIWAKIITAKKVVDTGRFRNSLNFKVNNNEVIIGSGVEYAEYLELGTSKMKARPTLKPTIEDYRESYRRIIEQEMKN